MLPTEFLDNISGFFLDDFLDILLCGIIYGVHSHVRTCPPCLAQPTAHHGCDLIVRPGFDIFGRSYTAKVVQSDPIVCPNCANKVNPARLAPHLEKCLGGGRQSGRIATRRIATQPDLASYANLDIDSGDSTHDADWVPPGTRSRKGSAKVAKGLEAEGNHALAGGYGGFSMQMYGQGGMAAGQPYVSPFVPPGAGMIAPSAEVFEASADVHSAAMMSMKKRSPPHQNNEISLNDQKRSRR